MDASRVIENLLEDPLRAKITLLHFPYQAAFKVFFRKQTIPVPDWIEGNGFASIDHRLRLLSWPESKVESACEGAVELVQFHEGMFRSFFLLGGTPALFERYRYHLLSTYFLPEVVARLAGAGGQEGVGTIVGSPVCDASATLLFPMVTFSCDEGGTIRKEFRLVPFYRFVEPSWLFAVTYAFAA